MIFLNKHNLYIYDIHGNIYKYIYKYLKYLHNKINITNYINYLLYHYLT